MTQKKKKSGAGLSRPPASRKPRKPRSENRRPTILVLEALSGGSECVRTEGGESVDVSPSNIARACEHIDSYDWDGLLLTGGGDVDPRLYGQRPRKETYGVSENRDLVETYALEVARKRGHPVLGICRGVQIINVEAGGTLKQHFPGHRGTEHVVLSRDGTILREFSGLEPVVISLHHQRLEEIAGGFEVSGRASDGTIESIEDSGGRVLGVQFHPEMDWLESYAQALFRWLVLESAIRAGLPEPEREEYPEERWTRGYNPSKFHTVGRTSKHHGNRSKGSTYTLPRYSPMNGVTQTWICPHCALRFDDFTDRDDHVAFLHDGMVTPLTDEILQELKRGSRRDSTTSTSTDLVVVGSEDLTHELRPDVKAFVQAAVDAGWKQSLFGQGVRLCKFTSPTEPVKHFIVMLNPRTDGWRNSLTQSMKRAGAPFNKEEEASILVPSPSPSSTP